MIISEENLASITGGSSTISGTLISSICKLISTLLDLGRTVGSAIRTYRSGNTCS